MRKAKREKKGPKRGGKKKKKKKNRLRKTNGGAPLPLREWDSQKQQVLPPIKEPFNQNVLK